LGQGASRESSGGDQSEDVLHEVSGELLEG
jgi:hypothetical protein